MYVLKNGKAGMWHLEKAESKSGTPKAKAEAKSETPKEKSVDAVNHPPHYKQHPSGVECIAITEHMGFCLGNAVKYIWRADEKGKDIEDLKKARWYIDREIEKREGT